MEKVLKFGKIDFYNTGRKINALTVEIRLQDKPQGAAFSAMAMVWNSRHTDCVAGGQCLDAPEIMRAMAHNKLYLEIVDLWKKYHLNDMHAGTPTQEKCLQEHENERDAIKKQLEQSHPYYNCKYLQPNISYYDISCEILKKYNLYTVTHNGKPYTYGHAWLFEPIPEKDLQRIREITTGGAQ